MEQDMDKAPGQRKKRLDRTYTKQARSAFLRGSLNDVSSHPLGEFDQKDSTLRRSRSLAISRADIFTNLDIPNQQRRSQLIPRAKLVDKSAFKDRRYQSNNEGNSKRQKRQSLPKSKVIPIPKSPKSNYQSVNGYKPENQDILVYSGQLAKFAGVNYSEKDSLDSNYHNKSSFQSIYQVSQENLQYDTDLGLSLPNYYPDSKYDTDISVTAENVSLFSDTDFYDGNSRSLPNYAYEYDSSLSDLEPRYYESNTFNPIFSEYDYQSVSDSCSELNNFDEITVINNKNKDEYDSIVTVNETNQRSDTTSQESDLNVDDKLSIAASSRTSTLKGSDKINLYELEDPRRTRHNSPDNQEQQPTIHSEFHEIPPDDINEIKADQVIYSTVQKTQDHITLITIDDNAPIPTPSIASSPDITLASVVTSASISSTPTSIHGIISSGTSPTPSSSHGITPTSDIVSTSDRKTSKSDSKIFGTKKSDIKRQNYLKDLLEHNSQKRPIKNFIAKNISKAFGDKDFLKKSSKVNTSDLQSTTATENQYHSLPDINASKYLQKCEKIDRKLRKCDKLGRTKSNADEPSSKNRFVVNIGQHFNLQNQNARIPVDFEVKISKVPKIQKTPTKSNSFSGRNTTSITINTEKQLENRPKSKSANQKEESKLSNFSTITKQTKEKLLSGFKKSNTADSKSQDKHKIKPLPKITEVFEKKDEDSYAKNKKINSKLQLKTIRNYTKIDEKPENRYNSCSELDSLEYPTWNSEKTFTSLPADLPFSPNEINTDLNTKNTPELIKMEKPHKISDNNNGLHTTSPSPVQEFQEKLDTMRCFWDKMINKAQGEDGNKSPDIDQLDNGQKSPDKDESDNEHKSPSNLSTESEQKNDNIIHESPPPKVTISRFESMKDQNSPATKKPEPCKIVDVQSKIETVRKIFEPPSETTQQQQSPESSPSLVETNRKIFEPRLSEKFDDKMGTFVKESCGIFENPYFERFSSVSPSCTTSDSSNQFESLNPNIVEIIENEKLQKIKESKENLQRSTEDYEKLNRYKNSKECKEVIKKSNNGLKDNTITPKLSDFQKKEVTAGNIQKAGSGCNKHPKIVGCENKTKPTALVKTKSFDPQFDHVRYKVMKSDLFQKNIFANYEKETQFDGLMQYLQDYSFQELLIDNNIVIIEPIRTKVEFSDAPKKTKKITQIPAKSVEANSNKEGKQSVMRRHFFYHPIRVNREVNDAELPNPDTVKQVRKFFESTGIMKKSQSHNEIDNPPKKRTIRYQTVIEPQIHHHCSESDTNSEKYQVEVGLVEENCLESLASDNTCCIQQYVSEDVLQKIRECGTCITYYGGKVLEANNNNRQSLMTKAIMEEIKGSQKRNDECACRKRNANKTQKEIKTADGVQKEAMSNCKIVEDKITFKAQNDPKTNNKEVYQGIKFKLIKSNSCSSRLELVGTENVSEYRKKFLERQKQVIYEQNLKNQQLLNGNHDKIEPIKEIKEISNNESVIKETTGKINDSKSSKDLENATENKSQKEEESPKIVAEEKKVTQWATIKEEKSESQATVLKEQNSHYIDYRDYERMRRNSRKYNDMEFEPYEVLEH